MDRQQPDAAKRRYPRLQVRVSDEQLADIHARAAAAGLSVPDYVRTACLGEALLVRYSPTLPPALVHELNRIGVNLNQLAKHANAGRIQLHSIEAVLAELTRLLGEVRHEPEHR